MLHASDALYRSCSWNRTELLGASLESILAPASLESFRKGLLLAPEGTRGIVLFSPRQDPLPELSPEDRQDRGFGRAGLPLFRHPRGRAGSLRGSREEREGQGTLLYLFHRRVDRGVPFDPGIFPASARAAAAGDAVSRTGRGPFRLSGAGIRGSDTWEGLHLHQAGGQPSDRRRDPHRLSRRSVRPPADGTAHARRDRQDAQSGSRAQGAGGRSGLEAGGGGRVSPPLCGTGKADRGAHSGVREAES